MDRLTVHGSSKVKYQIYVASMFKIPFQFPKNASGVYGTFEGRPELAAKCQELNNNSSTYDCTDFDDNKISTYADICQALWNSQHAMVPPQPVSYTGENPKKRRVVVVRSGASTSSAAPAVSDQGSVRQEYTVMEVDLTESEAIAQDYEDLAIELATPSPFPVAAVANSMVKGVQERWDQMGGLMNVMANRYADLKIKQEGEIHNCQMLADGLLLALENMGIKDTIQALKTYRPSAAVLALTAPEQYLALGAPPTSPAAEAQGLTSLRAKAAAKNAAGDAAAVAACGGSGSGSGHC